MKSHKAWLLDLDGTLYRATPVRAAMACELVAGHWSRIPILKAFRHEQERLREQLHEEVACPYTLQLERTAEKLARPLTEVTSIVSEWMIERPGKWLRMFRRQRLLDEITQFRAAGGKTAVVSDYPASTKLRALKIDHLFDVVVANGEPGGPRRLKPWPDGYCLASQQLGIPAADCLVIGDRTDADGEAAKQAGMDFRLIR